MGKVYNSRMELYKIVQFKPEEWTGNLTAQKPIICHP